MDLMVIIIGCLLAAAVIAGLVIYGLWKIPVIGKIASISFGGAICFVVVTALWPLNSFYVEELEYSSNLLLSDTYKVLAKRSSYPDFHGDYYSEAVIEVHKLDLSNLSNDLMPGKTCHVPEFAKPYLSAEPGPASCWDSSREGSQSFQLTYFTERRILHFKFAQT